jgi:high-affinity Fe2+/Pb2+ permease
MTAAHHLHALIYGFGLFFLILIGVFCAMESRR